LIAQNSIERKINLQAKKPLPVLAMAVNKPRAINCDLTSSQTSCWSPQNSREKNTINNRETTAGTRQWLWASLGPWAMSLYVHNQADGPLKTQLKKKKIYKQKTIARTGSGYNQARGHQLWAHMLTIKLIGSSEFSLKKQTSRKKTTTGTGSGFEQARDHQLRTYMLTIKLMVSSKLTGKNKILPGKNHCRYRQWLWASPGPSAFSSQAHKSSWFSPQNWVERKKIYKQKTTTGTWQWMWPNQGPWAMSTHAHNQALW
jgi:hypothetical protein